MLGHRLSDLDQPAADLSLGDSLPDIGKFEFKHSALSLKGAVMSG
jgi:hypothetical protein